MQLEGYASSLVEQRSLVTYKLLYPERGTLPVNERIQSDVVIVGGGPAGSLAALSAAREGAKVVVVERNAYLGGAATAGLMGQMVGAGRNGKPVFGGISLELVNHLIERGQGKYNERPMRDKPGTMSSFRYSIPALTIALDHFMDEAGVQVLYDCTVAQVEELEDGCVLTVKGTYEQIEVEGKAIVDATGNASVAHMMGHETYKPPVDDAQAIALIFKLGNVDIEKLVEYQRNMGVLGGSLAAQAYKEGGLPAEFLAMAPIPGTNEVVFNATMISQIDHESLRGTSEALPQLRKQIPKIADYLKRRLPGLENAFLSQIASALGVREARRIIGKYWLLGKDLVEMRDFPDSIAIGVFPIDIHDQHGGMVWVETDGPYKIPFSCLLPKRDSRLICAGKCISADNEAFSSTRVIPPSMLIGEAAGCAAAIAAFASKSPGEVDAREVQEVLRKRGCHF